MTAGRRAMGAVVRFFRSVLNLMWRTHGHLVRQNDCSKSMEEIRARLVTRPLGPNGTSQEELMKWIELVR